MGHPSPPINIAGVMFLNVCCFLCVRNKDGPWGTGTFTW